jgi:hypothetical protein
VAVPDYQLPEPKPAAPPRQRSAAYDILNSLTTDFGSTK